MNVTEIIDRQRKFFNGGMTRDFRFRRQMLKNLQNAIKGRAADIAAALFSDLGKNAFESYVSEISIVLGEIKFMSKKLRKLTKPKRVRSSLLTFPSKSVVYKEPYGVALVMSPWNYPFQLTMNPLVGAIAAGNCVVVKPSAYAPATSAIVAKLIEEIYPPEYVAAVEGGRRENAELLEGKFDVIFFTGGETVGRLVMKKAAEHLTPVVLELGGKSPCIVDETADIKQAAKRIVWGKGMNAGQTCVAPDYVLAHRSIAERLAEELKNSVNYLYGEKQTENGNFPKIISEKHFDRVCAIVDDAEESGDVLVCGGGRDPETRKIDFTVLLCRDADTPAMREEIFGPVLPVIPYDDFGDMLSFIVSEKRPLALYVFTKSKEHERMALTLVPFGGGCVNDTVMHLTNPRLPFGGIGESGMGSYHGKASFEAFSHTKSVLKKRASFDLPFRYLTRKDTKKIADMLLGRKKD